MHDLLKQISADTPGRYLTEVELKQLEVDPYLRPRVAAARLAREKEPIVLDKTLNVILRRYEFEKKHGYGREKCYRDVGSVYQWCVFAMLCDDVSLLENKLLFWMRTVIQAFGFPGGNNSIRDTYSLLRKEMNKRVGGNEAELLDPFFASCERILPAETEQILADYAGGVK